MGAKTFPAGAVPSISLEKQTVRSWVAQIDDCTSQKGRYQSTAMDGNLAVRQCRVNDLPPLDPIMQYRLQGFPFKLAPPNPRHPLGWFRSPGPG